MFICDVKDLAKNPCYATGDLFVGAIAPNTVELCVDSQAAPSSKYHFIRDETLFISMAPLSEEIMVSVGGGTSGVRMGGTIEITHPDTGATTRIANCLYSSDFPKNIINVEALRRNGAVWDVDKSPRCEDRLEFGDNVFNVQCQTFAVAAPLPARRDRVSVPVMVVESVQRGAHGKLHITVDKRSPVEKAKFDLWMSRLNDPSLEQALHMHEVADGVPDVLRTANAVNTAKLARLLADPPQSAPKAGRTPVPERAGAMTQIDWWSGPCVSIVGNKGMTTAYDAASSNFKLYPASSKSLAPQAVDRYFVDAKAAGVNIDDGGTVYADNERVLNSAKMLGVTDEHELARKNSLEYTPTGNTGAESTFRIAGHDIRKNLIRAGTPDEFWDFAALDVQDLMESTRLRGAKSPGEMFDGKRRDVSRRRVWGCLVVAKKYPTWVASKTDDRGVLGINLGRSHSKPGYIVWSPDFGVLASKHVTFYETVFPFKDGTFALHGGSTGGGVSFSAAGVDHAPTAEDIAGDDGDEGEAAVAADDSASQRSGSGMLQPGGEAGDDDGDGASSAAGSDEDDDEIGIPLVPGNPNMVAHHQSRSASSQSQSQSLTHSSQMLDDEDVSSGVEADPNQPHEGRTGLFVNIVEAVEMLDAVASAPPTTTVEVLLSMC